MPVGKDTLVIAGAEQLGSIRTRRDFLRVLGVGGTVVLLPTVFAACDDDDDGPSGGNGDEVVLNLSNDIGIINYAFALEQLEAAFYSQVVGASNFGTLFTNAVEIEILTDVRNHEVIHREFFRTALGTSAIPDLEVDFGTALDSRQSILETARTFEDLGVAAYNGAGKYLTRPENLLVAGKIVSVEARHAAVFRDLLDTTGREFAGDEVVDPGTGLDQALEPSDVLGAADDFIVTEVEIGTGPTP